MLAKIVAWGPDRAAARRRLGAALAETEVVGPATNLDFLTRVTNHDAFAAGAVATTFVEDHAAELVARACRTTMRLRSQPYGCCVGSAGTPRRRQPGAPIRIRPGTGSTAGG